VPLRPRVVTRYLERGHSWIGDEDGDEYRCENCGRTLWIPMRPDGTTVPLDRYVLKVLDCPTEQVRQVMES
jgi:hypothetical protein